MAYLIVRHTVEDFNKWKTVFDAHASDRKAYGAQNGVLLRGANNEVVAIFQWCSLEDARAFSQSDTLRTAMQNSGVSGAPSIYFGEKVEDLAY